MKILHTADWHFGHGRTDASSTIESLEKFLFPYIGDVDLVIVAGDVFDNALLLPTPSTREVMQFFIRLFDIIESTNTPIIFLKGTTLHDRNQVSLLNVFPRFKNTKRLITIVDTPSIIDTAFGSFLCLPDDLPFPSREVLLEFINELLLQQSDGKVDYAIVHGMFDFACPGADQTNSYRVDDFKDIVRNQVMCGHVHRAFHVGKVFYSGSFDRFAHNEEHPKGFWIHETGTESIFIENKDAIKYLTFQYDQSDLKLMCAEHERNMNNNFANVKYGYCRVLMAQSNLRQSFRKYHLTRWKNIHLKFKRIKGTTYLSDDDIVLARTTELEPPTKSNLAKIIHAHIDEPNFTIEDVRSVLDRL